MATDAPTVMLCAFCWKTKKWPEHFVNRTFAQCLVCWLKEHPEQVQPMREALRQIDGGQTDG